MTPTPRIRPATAADADAMRDLYAHYVAETAVSLEETPPSRAVFRARFRRVAARTPWLVCESGDGESGIVGYAYAAPFHSRAGYRWTVEVSLYVRRGFERRGFGRALYRALFRRLRALGYCRAVAAIGIPNPPSVALHEKMGFRPVGILDAAGRKFGEWRDVGWWQLPLRPLPENPAPPQTTEEAGDFANRAG